MKAISLGAGYDVRQAWGGHRILFLSLVPGYLLSLASVNLPIEP
jgi:hypothetical protein